MGNEQSTVSGEGGSSNNDVAAREKREKEKDLTNDRRAKMTAEDIDVIEKERVTRLSPHFPEADPRDLLRFLRAREMNLKNAGLMYTKARDFLAEYKPWVCEEDVIMSQLGRGIIYLLNVGKDPIIYWVLKNFVPKKDTEELVRAAMHYIHLIISSTNSPPEAKFTMILNCHKVSMKNFDLKITGIGIEYYQNYFPERLKVAYVIGLPTPLIGMYKVIEKLMDERTRRKIKFLKMSEASVLQDEYPLELIPSDLGGLVEELNQDLFVALRKQWMETHDHITGETLTTSPADDTILPRESAEEVPTDKEELTETPSAQNHGNEKEEKKKKEKRKRTKKHKPMQVAGDSGVNEGAEGEEVQENQEREGQADEEGEEGVAIAEEEKVRSRRSKKKKGGVSPIDAFGGEMETKGGRSEIEGENEDEKAVSAIVQEEENANVQVEVSVKRRRGKQQKEGRDQRRKGDTIAEVAAPGGFSE
eukprot:TRINITY_DN893_c2_g1_i5.p1 TRINITY_DN893_c2_g1~~TRINITY_DN893_c2_g1_i5.p1  ORF type:complete len:475 (-),score=139.03 TRINITY_DN893_c2_g1_i5:68-1492(-)